MIYHVDIQLHISARVEKVNFHLISIKMMKCLTKIKCYNTFYSDQPLSNHCGAIKTRFKVFNIFSKA